MLALPQTARHPKTGGLLAAFFAVISLIASPAEALLINISQTTSGPFTTFGGQGNADSAPSLTGAGTLSTVMNAAADYWEGIIGDTGATLNIEYGWQDIGGNTLGVATQVTNRNFGGSGKPGLIRFDSTGTSWFADSTPLVASEYLTFNESTHNLGGGTMVTGRSYVADFSSPLFSTYDLFSVAIHEIGHLLGLGDFGETEFHNGTLAITSGPFSGAGVPLIEAGGGHINASTAMSLQDALMTTSIFNGQRKLASDADIAAIAELSGFTTVNYGAAVAAIPEPSQWLAFGLLAAAGVSRPSARRRAATV